jgi:hypothetical protein
MALPQGFVLENEAPAATTSPEQTTGLPAGFELEDVTTAKQVSTFDYIANEAKKGLADSAVLGQAILDTFLIDPITGKPGGIGERFGGNVKRLQKAAASITGAKEGLKAPSTVTEIVGGGARMLSDPVGYVGGGAVKAGKTIVETAAPIVSRALGLFGLGTIAETGGITGQAIEKQITGEDTGTGRAIGSITTAIKGAPLATAGAETFQTGVNAAKQVYDKYKAVKTDPSGTSQAYATGATKRLLEIIAKEQPGQKLDLVVDEFNRIGNLINQQDVPLMVAMSDNPVVRQQVERLAKENPAFRQRVNTELQNLATAIDSRADVLFGQRYTPVKGIESVDISNAYKRRQSIDDQIESLSAKFIPSESKANIGVAIENLVGARQKAARAEVSPVYEQVLQDAKRAGAKLPEEGVRDIYNFVKLNNMQDIFGVGTPLDRAIKTNFAPKNKEFFPVNFDTVDSLKREINRLQTKPMSADSARRLNDLEDVVNNSRQSIPGDFNQRLIDTDKLYYEKVGVPFSAQGIKEIDAKKYAEQVAPVIIKNGSALKQFIGAVGEDGQTIARNAVYADVYNKVIKNDTLDAKALQRYIQQKDDVLQQLPDVKSELKKAVVDDSILKLARANINDAVVAAEKRIADNFVLSVKDSNGVAVPNYTEVSNRLFSDPNFYAKISKDLKDLDATTSKAVRNSIRAEVVNKAREFPDGGIDFLTNPKNAKVINSLFGSGYRDAVKDLVRLSDAVNKADIDRLGAVVTRSELDVLAQRVPGLDIPFVTSTIRDRISSVPQKAVRLLTRINTANLKADTDAAITELLLDPNGLKQLQNAAKTFDFKIENPASLKRLQDSISSTVPRYVYGGTKAAIMEQQEEPTAPSGPALEFGRFE